MSSKSICSLRCVHAVGVIVLLMLTVTPGQAGELNPAAVIYKLPDQIEWKGTGGNRNAVLVGDPEKPGLYIVINKWLAGNNFSRPQRPRRRGPRSPEASVSGLNICSRPAIPRTTRAGAR
jgi:hypothetical protein